MNELIPAVGLRLAQARRAAPRLGFALASGPGTAPAPPEEEAECRDMAPERRTEFLLGRRALRGALTEAGIPVTAVPREGLRPRLPDGSVGSLSHSGSLAVAVAGPAHRFRAVGIDLELEPLPLRAARLLVQGEEQEWVTAGHEAAGRRLLAAFSAKEAAFKALDPLLAQGAGTARGLRMRPPGTWPGPGPADASAAPFVVWSPRCPSLRLEVTVCPVGNGVLSWTVLRDGPRGLSAPTTAAPGPGR